jgi:hypothetical protein
VSESSLEAFLSDRLVCCGEPAPTHAPWCSPTTLVVARAAVGLSTRPVGTANRAQFVAVSVGGVECLLFEPVGAT